MVGRAMYFLVVLLCVLSVPWPAAARSLGSLEGHVERLVAGLEDGVGPSSTKKRRVALFPLTREDSDEVTKVGTFLQEAVGTSLIRSKVFTLVNRRRLKRLLRDLNFQTDDLIREETRQKIGRSAGADLLAVGTYWDLGSQIKISLSLYDIASADAIAAQSCLVRREKVPSALFTAASTKTVTAARQARKTQIDASGNPAALATRSRLVKVVISSNPPGAKVHCNELPPAKRYLGKTWRPIERFFEPGSRSFTFTLAGRETQTVRSTIVAPGPALVRAKLVPPKGHLSFKVEPPAAVLTVDGVVVSAAQRDNLALAAGRHVIQATAPGYVDQRKVIELGAGEGETIVLRLQRSNYTDKAGIEYIWVEPGSFWMGASPGDAAARSNEFPRHRVTLTKGFWLGKYEVTQRQWTRVMAQNRSHYKGRRRPVENISWHDAQAFCRRLSQQEHAVCRLPSEAEWEYACRAGLDSPRYGPTTAIAWIKANSRGSTRDVGRLPANPWGFCDMLGNVYEWTRDSYSSYRKESQTDPIPIDGQHTKIARGGCFAWDETWARASARYRRGPQHTKALIGLRVLREP